MKKKEENKEEEQILAFYYCGNKYSNERKLMVFKRERERECVSIYIYIYSNFGGDMQPVIVW